MIKVQDIPSLLGAISMGFSPVLAAAVLSAIGMGAVAPMGVWLSGALLTGGLVAYAFDYRCHRQAAPATLLAVGGLLLWAGRYSSLGGTGWQGWPLWGSGGLMVLAAFVLNLRARSRFCVVRPAKPAQRI